MLYRSLNLTSFLLAVGLLWNASPGWAYPLIAQSGQPATPESQPVNPLLLGTPTSERSPANVIVPIVPTGDRGQSDRDPSKTVVPTSPSGQSSTPAPVLDRGTTPTPTVDFPQPSELIKPPESLPTPPVAAERQSPSSQSQSAPSSPAPASDLARPKAPTSNSPADSGTPITPTSNSPADPGTATTPTTSSPSDAGASTNPPADSEALPQKPAGLQTQPGNIINFGTEPSPPPLIAEPLRLQIKLSQRQVTLYRGEDVVKRYPIAVGRPGWETPKGKFQVQQMFKNPVWISPLQKGVTIPGGDPENPLGRFWIGFWTDGKNWIGFHGTPNPRSVGTAASHGCIRMYNKDIEDLFQRISLGVEVTVVD